MSYSQLVARLEAAQPCTEELDRDWAVDARDIPVELATIYALVDGHDVTDVALVQAARPDAIRFYLRGSDGDLHAPARYLDGVDVQIVRGSVHPARVGGRWRAQPIGGRPCDLYEANGKLRGHVIRYAATPHYTAVVFPDLPACQVEHFVTRKEAMEWVEQST